MRIKFVLLTALILALGVTGFAHSKITYGVSGAGQSSARLSPQTQTIQQLANAVADAFTEGTLSSLDAGRPYVGTVRVVVNSLVDVERKTFRSLAQVERWLKSGETQDGEITLPRRNRGELQQCRRGICTFENAGGLHNILYVQKIAYGMRKGKPYIKAIYLVND